MKRKWIIVIFSITILAIILFGFRFINEKINGNPDKIRRTAQILKEQMEEKYNIVIIDSEGSYSHMVGYGAKLTTENNITFRSDGAVIVSKKLLLDNESERNRAVKELEETRKQLDEYKQKYADEVQKRLDLIKQMVSII